MVTAYPPPPPPPPPPEMLDYVSGREAILRQALSPNTRSWSRNQDCLKIPAGSPWLGLF